MSKPHSKPNALDREELEAWKAHPVTQWVLAQCEERRRHLVLQTKDRLYNQSHWDSPQDWALLQSWAARQAGLSDGLTAFMNIEVEEPEA